MAIKIEVMMSIKREHTLLACRSSATVDSIEFNKIALRASINIKDKTLIAEIPPPERVITLNIVVTDMDNIMNRSLSRSFGFVFSESEVNQGGFAMMKFTQVLNGIIRRTIRDNSLIHFYGINVIIYTQECSEQECLNMYSYLADWCRGATHETKQEITFDIVQNSEQFDYAIRNEHFRMVHGDVRAQYSAAQASNIL